MSRRTALLLVCGLVVLLVGVGVLAATSGGDDQPPSAVVVVPEAERRPLPAFSGPSVRAGEPAVDLDRYKGRPVVLNFWASWCGPCRAEQRGLDLASQRLASRGVAMVGVNVRDDRAAAGAYMEEFGVSYPSLFDRPGRLAASLGDDAPLAPPWTVVVDAKGRIAARIAGAVPGGARAEEQAAALERVVDQALGAGAGR